MGSVNVATAMHQDPKACLAAGSPLSRSLKHALPSGSSSAVFPHADFMARMRPEVLASMPAQEPIVSSGPKPNESRLSSPVEP